MTEDPQTPAEHVQWARDVLGWTDKKINGSRYALENGIIYRGHMQNMAGLEAYERSVTRSDAEIADAKAKYGDAFSTKYGIAYTDAKGFIALGEETTRSYVDRHGKRRYASKDIWSGWDRVAMRNGRLHCFQFHTMHAGDIASHVAKLNPDSPAMKTAEKLGATRWRIGFERGDEQPKAIWKWLGCLWKEWPLTADTKEN